MKRLLCRGALIAGVGFLALGGDLLASTQWQWSVDRFLVYAEGPTKPAVPEEVSSAADGLSYQPMPHNTRIEDELHWIAGRYENASLMDPNLGPVVDRPGGGEAYAIFLFSFAGSDGYDPGTEGGYHSLWYGGCQGPASGYLAFNDKGAARSEFFRTMAHELLHAVQRSYYWTWCAIRDRGWVKEGMADGVSQYVFARKFGRDAGARSGIRSAQGLRPYQVPLNFEAGAEGSVPRVATDDSLSRPEIGYATSSFWRFLTEAAGGPAYLGTLLRRSVGGANAPSDALRWLNEGLKADPAFNGDELYALFPEFVTEFASWGGARYTVVAEEDFGDDRDAARREWLRLAFNGCEEIVVRPGDPKSVDLSIDPMAARCVRVRYRAPFVDTPPLIEAVHRSKKPLDGLHLGVAWERGPGGERNCWKRGSTYRPGKRRCVVKAQQLKSTDSRWARDWNDASIPSALTARRKAGTRMADTEKVYVISNVQPKSPWETKAVEVTFRVGLPATELDSGEETGPPKASVPKESEAVREAVEKAKSGEQVSMDEALELVEEMLGGMNPEGPTPEQMYGAFGGVGPPVAIGEMGSFTFERGDGEQVTVQVMPAEDGAQLSFGETGALHGSVSLDTDNTVQNSSLCESTEALIGLVVESSEDRLVLRISADICEWNQATPLSCVDGCPKVDHVGATLMLPAGWRYYASSAPETIVTEGIRDYVRRFTGRDPTRPVTRTDDAPPSAPAPDVTRARNGDRGGSQGDAHEPTEPASTICEGPKVLATGLTEPGDVVMRDGRIFLVDQAEGGRILEVRSDGGKRVLAGNLFPGGRGGMQFPARGLLASGNGLLVAAGNVVKRVTLEGGVATVLETEDFLVFDVAPGLGAYVVAGPSGIGRLDPQAAAIQMLVPVGEQFMMQGLGMPNSLVSKGSAVIFTDGMANLGRFEAGDLSPVATLDSPEGLVGEGDAYVVVEESGRLVRVGENGEVEVVAEDLAQDGWGLSGVTVTEDGYLVTDRSGGRLLKVLRDSDCG